MMTIRFFLFLFFFYTAFGFDRKLITRLNPDCPEKKCSAGVNSSINIVYTRAVATDSVVHYLIGGGFNQGPLSALLLYTTGENSKVIIDWKNFTESDPTKRIGSFSVENGEVLSAFALVFNRLLEFNDTTDSAQLPPGANSSIPNRVWPLEDLLWADVDLESGRGGVEANHIAVFRANTTSTHHPSNTTEDDLSFGDEEGAKVNDLFNAGGFVSVKFEHSGTPQRQSSLPRLSFTGNNTQISLTLNNLRSNWNGSRYAVEAAIVTSYQLTSKAKMSVREKRTVDDEYTPGIFKMLDLLGQPEDVPWDESCYLQWKPVCYTSDHLHLLESVEVHNSVLSNHSSQLNSSLRNSLAYVWFGDLLLQPEHTSFMNITFGTPKDGFYLKFNYTHWTSSFGFGTPPADNVSILVILIIACGLGIPFLLIIGGSIYIFARKRIQANASTYQAINS